MEAGGEENKLMEVVAKTPYKSKRDEWSEVGILSLLDVYESKWLLRNRAKLKGNDWEDISQQVSTRVSPVKTPNQCKNKIESMKKRYRVESAANNHPGLGSSWQFYTRMDKLLKGSQFLQSKVEDLVGDSVNDIKEVNDKGPVQAQNCEIIELEKQNHVQASDGDDGPDTVPEERESSTPCNEIANAGEGSRRINARKRRMSLGGDFAESMRLLASSILKIEQVRMDMERDCARLRVEAEMKRAEMELKRTEIMAKTQLQIAKLFVNRACNRNNKSASSTSVAAEVEPIVVEMNTEGKKG